MIHFYELNDDNEYDKFAKLSDDGEFIEGKEELLALDPNEEAWENPQIKLILSRFNGPEVVAKHEGEDGGVELGDVDGSESDSMRGGDNAN